MLLAFELDASMPHATASLSKDSMVLPQGPVTRARAKVYKESIAAFVAQLWDETLLGRSEKAYPSSMNLPYNCLQVQFSSPSSPPAQVSLHSAQNQLTSLEFSSLPVPQLGSSSLPTHESKPSSILAHELNFNS
ncbi:hypothetical protein PVK06_024565 [Gossypium arboreum]|uniref:Uncharacterized protein n=1 Tax=Gossypium arboreum TaxID=29729 RepID=A0ABR0PEB0_GOSAR|nr:hypothetical protein PVK06_024565 [Gossypium arboreum]